MTKKEDNKSSQDLQEKLDEMIKEKDEKEQKETKRENKSTDLDDIESLKSQITKLEKEKNELTEMAKRAQYDYINLKVDFDRFVRQTQEKNKTIAVDYLIEIVKKFLPFIENLRKSLENVAKSSQINTDLSQDPITKWLQLTYDNFIKTLESMNIYPIVSVGELPDTLFHEPVSTSTIQDKKMKWKIIQEFERGFFYRKDWDTKVINTSKVIVAN